MYMTEEFAVPSGFASLATLASAAQAQGSPTSSLVHNQRLTPRKEAAAVAESQATGPSPAAAAELGGSEGSADRDSWPDKNLLHAES